MKKKKGNPFEIAAYVNEAFNDWCIERKKLEIFKKHFYKELAKRLAGSQPLSKEGQPKDRMEVLKRHWEKNKK